MAMQRYLPLSGMFCEIYDCQNPKENLIALPDGIEIDSISLKVLEAAEAGTKFSLGFKGESGAVLNEIEVDVLGKEVRSESLPDTNIARYLKATINNKSATGKFKVRVSFYFPSTNLLECAVFDGE